MQVNWVAMRPSDHSKAASDDELVDSLVKGQMAAFDELYGRYKRLVYGYLHRMLGKRSDLADDLFQVTWSQVARKASTYKGPNKFRGWLLQITRNAVNMHFRDHEKIEGESLEEDKIEYATPVELTVPSFEADVISRHELSRVLHALTQLPERQRLVITQWLTEECSYEELAHSHGLSLANTKSTLFRARKALSEILGRESDE